MDDRAHTCLSDFDLEDHVFEAMRLRALRNQRDARHAVLLLLAALVLGGAAFQWGRPVLAILAGIACALWLSGLVLAVRSRRVLTYDAAFRAAGLERLDLHGHLEVTTILVAAPELRADLAVWTGHGLPLRQRDLWELRRLAQRQSAQPAPSWSDREAA